MRAQMGGGSFSIRHLHGANSDPGLIPNYARKAAPPKRKVWIPAFAGMSGSGFRGPGG